MQRSTVLAVLEPRKERMQRSTYGYENRVRRLVAISQPNWCYQQHFVDIIGLFRPTVFTPTAVNVHTL